MRRITFAFILTLTLFAARRAHANDSPSGSALAESLFDEAIVLMSEHAYDRACPKLEESQRLDPGGGTLLNLARCYEEQGRLATAWTTYRQALGVARRDAREDRMAFAEGELAHLKTRVPRVQLRIAEKAPGLEVRIDGVKIGEAAWDGVAPVDPGTHRVEATAPGKRAFSTELRLEEGEQKEVAIPKLEDAPHRMETHAAGAPIAARPATEAPHTPPPATTQRTIGWTLGGVGAASLVTSALFGVLAVGAESTASAVCPGSPCNDPRGLEASTRAHSFATVATVTVIGGAALVVGGLVVLLTAPREIRAASRPGVLRF